MAGPTFGAVHVRAAYLVHQQHEDEAQDQRNADAGVKLLVAVLVLPTGAQHRFHFGLGLRHLCNPTVVVVSTCRGTSQTHLITERRKLLRSTNKTNKGQINAAAAALNFVLFKYTDNLNERLS